MTTKLGMTDRPDPAPAAVPSVQVLDSGYWHVRWNAEIWAQWPMHRHVTEDDFFHHSGTRERIAACNCLTLDEIEAQVE